jgi:raffinose/stachyose/melibiose transport system permease protein
MDAPTTNAGPLISLIPAVIFFFFFFILQRSLTRGVTAGAIKWVRLL